MSEISFEEAARAWEQTKSDRLAAALLGISHPTLQRILSQSPRMVRRRAYYHSLQRHIRRGGKLLTGKEIELLLRMVPDEEIK